MLDKTVLERIRSTLPYLNERQRRLYLAAEAKAIGRGGVNQISQALGVHRNTIQAGIKELEEDTGKKESDIDPDLIRRPGGGRKKAEEECSDLVDQLIQIVDGASYGNPENPLRWTTKTTRNIADELKRRGYSVSHVTVARMLSDQGFTLQQNKKLNQVGEPHPDREQQFQHINKAVMDAQEARQPVLSIDCKKKEIVGDFKNPGVKWQLQGMGDRVKDHDYAKDKAAPYGVYDINQNKAFVNVGISSDTAQFAVTSIRAWWQEMGQMTYPDANMILITADGGGSNGSKNRLFKYELQRFSDDTGLDVKVCHFPPGASKWNKIEHRLFSQITRNWKGEQLVSYQVIVNLIGSTTTKTGLEVKAALDETQYETGIKVTNQAMKSLYIEPDSWHGDWNYTIHPRIYYYAFDDNNLDNPER